MKRGGFTLIEVLLVATILSLLAAITFAALGPSRERARQSVCVSNMHQIGQAFALYRQDYDGADPIEGQQMSCVQLGLPTLKQAGDFQTAYVKNKEILHCPDWHGTIPASQMASTYRWVPDIDENALGGNFFSHLVEQRGMQTPLIYDDQHNPAFDISKEPRWTLKRIILLRLDQSVDNKQGPIRELPQYW